MEELLRTAWIQGGAFGLLVLSGWFMFWLERQERMRLQLKVEELLQSLTKFMDEQGKTIEDLTDKLQVEQMLKQEFDRRMK
jgi:hypothetical protein